MSDNQELAVNPFGSMAQRQEQTALVSQESDRAVAEVQSAMAIAKRFPRDQRRAYDNIIAACCRPGLAERALYAYAKGGSNITGPSIRLAEAIAQNWGNMQIGVRELEQRDGVSTMEAFAWDIESNTRTTRQFQIRHERVTRDKTTRLSDPRDIYELTANNGARRLRACILALIPGDVIEAAVEQCSQTLQKATPATPETIKALIDGFGRMGVTRADIEKRAQRSVEALNSQHMMQFKVIFQSIRDGIGKPSDYFDIAESAPSTESTKSRVKAVLSGKEPPQPQNEQPASKPTCPNPKCGRPVDAEMLAECVERGNCPACAPKSAGLNL